MVNAGIGTFGLALCMWLGGPPMIEHAGPDAVVIAGEQTDLSAEANAWGMVSGLTTPEVQCTGQQTSGKSQAAAAPCRLNVTENLPADVRSELGRTFEQPGPNCFATALKIARMSFSYRGVDAPEMKAFTEAYCEEIKGSPHAGDIGVYTSGPDPKTALWIHAFVYLTPNFVIEKQGVDYWGKTPVTLKNFTNMNYRAGASTECRRFAAKPKDCENKLTYYRCEPPTLSADLDEAFQSIDELATQMLDQKQTSDSDKEAWDRQYEKLNERVANTPLADKYKVYAQARLKSLKLQREFFR